jgi:hypothetical protein
MFLSPSLPPSLPLASIDDEMVLVEEEAEEEEEEKEEEEKEEAKEGSSIGRSSFVTASLASREMRQRQRQRRRSGGGAAAAVLERTDQRGINSRFRSGGIRYSRRVRRVRRCFSFLDGRGCSRGRSNGVERRANDERIEMSDEVLRRELIEDR